MHTHCHVGLSAGLRIVQHPDIYSSAYTSIITLSCRIIGPLSKDVSNNFVKSLKIHPANMRNLKNLKLKYNWEIYWHPCVCTISVCQPYSTESAPKLDDIGEYREREPSESTPKYWIPLDPPGSSLVKFPLQLTSQTLSVKCLDTVLWICFLLSRRHICKGLRWNLVGGHFI